MNNTQLELNKFINEFKKKHGPNPEFNQFTKDMTQLLTRMPVENEELARSFLSDLSDHLEVQFDNSELVAMLEVENKTKRVKSQQDNDQQPEKPMKKVRSSDYELPQDSIVKNQKPQAKISIADQLRITKEKMASGHFAKTTQLRKKDDSSEDFSDSKRGVSNKPCAISKPRDSRKPGVRINSNATSKPDTTSKPGTTSKIDTTRKPGTTSKPDTISIPIITRKLSSFTKVGLSSNPGNTKHDSRPSFYCAQWADKPRAKSASAIIYDIIDKPKDWINKMQKEYEDMIGNENPDDFDFTNLNLTREELSLMYRDLEPANFLHEKSEKFRLKAKVKQSWVAIALYITVKNETDSEDEQRQVFNKLRFIAKKAPYPAGFAKTTNALWRHCKNISRYHASLGDWVIFSPEIFDKLFFLEYPSLYVQPFIQKYKEKVPKEVLEFKRFH